MNRTAAYQFTIVVPLYNERDNLPQLEARLAAYLRQTSAAPACVLLVDDGSTDGGSPLVEAICARQPDFFFIRFARNRGLSAALKAGFAACGSPLVGYIDADLQTDPADFERLLPYAADYALVTGIRTRRRDSLVKRASSRIANAWRRMMTGDGVADTGCPLKVLRTDVAQKLPLLDGMHRFLPALVQMTGGSVKQVPVGHFPRTAGKAKYNLGNRLWKPFVDCFGFRWMRRRYVEGTIEKTDLT